MKKNSLKEVSKVLAIALVILTACFFAITYYSNYIGWYGYKKWEHRVHTRTVEESKKRQVFVKTLNFKFENFNGDSLNFQPFIERGFRYGKHTSEVTIPISNSEYPYQLSFDSRPTIPITILIRKDQLVKFDSTNSNWGFMRQPTLSDTIILTVGGQDIPRGGIVKVWE